MYMPNCCGRVLGGGFVGWGGEGGEIGGLGRRVEGRGATLKISRLGPPIAAGGRGDRARVIGMRV